MPRKTARANVNPAVLRWARESAGLDTAAVARRLHIKADTVQDWESGATSPTLGSVQALAVAYKRPLAAFFLPEPPSEPSLPRDYRTLPSRQPAALSRDALLAIREARRMQSIATELRQELHRDEWWRAARVKSHAAPESVAALERRRLGVTFDEQFGWRSEHAALRGWRAALERLGVLTFQLKLPVEEARGFCLPQGGLPAIAVSSRDAVAGRIFTLFHEYAHLLLGSSALCLPRPETTGRGQRTERFCNAFAGAVLVPLDALSEERHLQSSLRRRETAGRAISQLSSRFKVSRQVVLYRLRTMGVLSHGRFQDEMRRLDEEPRSKTKRRSGGPRPAKRCLQERGMYFADLVLEAQSRELITNRDASDYLSLRVKHFDEIQALVGE